MVCKWKNNKNLFCLFLHIGATRGTHTTYVTIMSVLTEGNVSSNILSFTPDDFLYTGSVCTSWKTISPTKHTSILTALDSASRLDVAMSSGLDTIELLDFAIVFGADMTVLRKIVEESICDTTMIPNYVAFTGNMEMVLFLKAPFDEFSLFEAVRGGQLQVVEHMIKEGCDVSTTPDWPRGFYDNDDFVRRCVGMATSAGMSDVVESLTMYVTDKYYQSDISCVQLAIRTNRLDILKVLHEGGALIPSYAFPLAVETANMDMLRYLETVKGTPDEDFVIDYISCAEFDSQTLELLLKNGLVQLDARDLQHAIHIRNKHTIDLLLQYGCAVEDETIDYAVAAWDFRLADSLMASHGCRPTKTSYQWLFTGGLCECCVAGFYPEGADDLYLRKLDWVYSATGGKLEFGSMSEMQSDACWSILLGRVSTRVVRWFEACMASKKQRVG